MTFYNQKWLEDRWFIKNSKGVCIWPFIWFYHEEGFVLPSVIAHEREHWKQQIRGLLLGYALRYWGEYAINRLKGMDNFDAYYNVSYERQAREASHR